MRALSAAAQPRRPRSARGSWSRRSGFQEPCRSRGGRYRYPLRLPEPRHRSGRREPPGLRASSGLRGCGSGLRAAPARLPGSPSPS
ncbi:hypothetical protein ABH15_07110 [Methanoculleus taiwanensis]|uniref:Uncharacterized protein n=1 Tax=Methanoculleus taiwanensis TaxID=1550565 RepID=A0A498H236_9EURY|nr:hypothetical protein ABH15_07110 [Methanoculleus taiwanensis]